MKKFFMEGQKPSMMRLLSFVTCITGLAIGIIAALKGTSNTSITSIALGFVAAGIAGKLSQKIKEK